MQSITSVSTHLLIMPNWSLSAQSDLSSSATPSPLRAMAFSQTGSFYREFVTGELWAMEPLPRSQMVFNLFLEVWVVSPLPVFAKVARKLRHLRFGSIIFKASLSEPELPLASAEFVTL